MIAGKKLSVPEFSARQLCRILSLEMRVPPEHLYSLDMSLYA